MTAADEDLRGHRPVVGEPVVTLLVTAELRAGVVQSQVGLVERGIGVRHGSPRLPDVVVM